MSTFKQIVEGYAGSVSNQHSAVDYEGASDRAVNKIRSEKLVKALGTSINHYNNVVRMYNKGIDTTNYDLSPGRTFGLHKTLNDFLNTTTLSEHDLLPVYHELIKHQAIVHNNDILPENDKLDNAIARIENHRNANNIIPELKKLRNAIS